jgi:hypothetical protein
MASPLDKEATMARSKDSTTPRFGTLHELLTRAEAEGFSVQLTVHDVTVPVALDWLQRDLLDVIEPGAQTNPPTGVMEAGEQSNGGRTSAVVFTDAPGRQVA